MKPFSVKTFASSEDPTTWASSLSELTRKFGELLRNGITFQDNVRAAWISQTFVGPAATLTFVVPYVTTPKAVLLTQCLDSGGVSHGLVFPWTFSTATGKSIVTTTAFAGLSAGTYTATMLVIPE